MQTINVMLGCWIVDCVRPLLLYSVSGGGGGGGGGALPRAKNQTSFQKSTSHCRF